jgi:hypothetical protein
MRKQEKKTMTAQEWLDSGLIGSIKKGTKLYKEIERLGSVEFSKRLADETFKTEPSRFPSVC